MKQGEKSIMPCRNNVRDKITYWTDKFTNFGKISRLCVKSGGGSN